MNWSSKYGHFDTVLISINRNLRQQCYLCFSKSNCCHSIKIRVASYFNNVSCLIIFQLRAENLVSCSSLIGEVRELGGRKYVVYQLSVKPHPTTLAPPYVEKTAF